MMFIDEKHRVAVAIALQTQVLRTCPEHSQVFCDDEIDPAAAFALALELVRQGTACVAEFRDNAHALTDLLSETIAAAPEYCPDCPEPVDWSMPASPVEEYHV